MKHAVITALILTGAAAGASDAQNSRSQNDPIVVSSERLTLASWSNTFAKRLDRNLDYPSRSFREERPSGVVSVSFRCSEDGRPSTIAVSRKSGDADLDHAAMRAVSRIKTLHPMPVSFKPDQKFRADILFATSEAQHDRQIRQLREEAKAGNAWLNKDRDVIALTIGSRARETS